VIARGVPKKNGCGNAASTVASFAFANHDTTTPTPKPPAILTCAPPSNSSPSPTS
jgi:hypothetical protein